MNKEEIIVQISTGGYLEHKVTHEAVCGKLMQLLGTIAVSKVIIGWSCSRELYEHVTGFLRQRGIECYLWLPVFSETGVLKADTGKLVDDTGTEAESYCLTDGENFEFYCPDQQRNITSFLQIYEEHFDGLGFDGVFLDKIRYGSFSNGLGGVFSCFCPACMKRYQECGIDVDELKHQMGLVRDGAGGYGEQVLGITAYDKGNYTFAHPVWEKFYRKKAEDIARALKTVTGYFHDRGMKVGMDTFAPYLAYFAGQDMKRLAPMADFIKPMMYRITNAPAGMPFETDCLIRETVRCNGTQMGMDARTRARKAFFEVLGCHDTGTEAFDLDFTARELTYMTGLGIPVYCGIEINCNEAAPSSPEYLRETMEGLKQVDMEGYVLSWDLMGATDGNLAAVSGHLGAGPSDGRPF